MNSGFSFSDDVWLKMKDVFNLADSDREVFEKTADKRFVDHILRKVAGEDLNNGQIVDDLGTSSVDSNSTNGFSDEDWSDLLEFYAFRDKDRARIAEIIEQENLLHDGRNWGWSDTVVRDNLFAFLESSGIREMAIEEIKKFK